MIVNDVKSSRSTVPLQSRWQNKIFHGIFSKSYFSSATISWGSQDDTEWEKIQYELTTYMVSNQFGKTKHSFFFFYSKSAQYNLKLCFSPTTPLSQRETTALMCLYPEAETFVFLSYLLCPRKRMPVTSDSDLRVLTKSRRREHITPIWKSSHWLPVSFRLLKFFSLTIKHFMVLPGRLI